MVSLAGRLSLNVREISQGIMNDSSFICRHRFEGGIHLRFLDFFSSLAGSESNAGIFAVFVVIDIKKDSKSLFKLRRDSEPRQFVEGLQCLSIFTDENRVVVGIKRDVYDVVF